MAKFDSAPISDSDNRLYLSIEIAGKCYFALIDTGAVASFIGAKVAEPMKQKIIPTEPYITLANGKLEKIKVLVDITSILM